MTSLSALSSSSYLLSGRLALPHIFSHNFFAARRPSLSTFKRIAQMSQRISWLWEFLCVEYFFFQQLLHSLSTFSTMTMEHEKLLWLRQLLLCLSLSSVSRLPFFTLGKLLCRNVKTTKKNCWFESPWNLDENQGDYETGEEGKRVDNSQREKMLKRFDELEKEVATTHVICAIFLAFFLLLTRPVS